MIWLTTAAVILLALDLSYQYAWWRPTVSFQHPRILMYHMISRQKPKKRYNKLRVDPVEFERQVRWLKENGWNFIHMSELKDQTGRKNVALTFDDGYRDNFLVADPILKKYNAKATIYLVVDRHDRDWSSLKKAHHTDGELAAEPKLLDQDVVQMLQSGRWELGGHTLTHDNLLNLSPIECRNEIESSLLKLVETFNTKVSSFAYPFGLFNESHVELVKECGFQNAVTTIQGISQNIFKDILTLPRIKVSGHDSLMSFRLRIRTGKCKWKD